MIEYLTGDATKISQRDPKELRIIAHIVNSYGGWGRGFVVALSRRWHMPEERYRKWSRHKETFKLGEIQMVPVKDEHGTIYIANMVAQDGYINDKNKLPLSYYSLSKCLKALDEWMTAYDVVRIGLQKPEENLISSIHMPRIGCGLGGGKWSKVETIINNDLPYRNVFVYDLSEGK